MLSVILVVWHFWDMRQKTIEINFRKVKKENDI